jgi:hypothetical protein
VKRSRSPQASRSTVMADWQTSGPMPSPSMVTMS